ncbi:TrkH family potassium uptake protein [Eisenibacter elegans]|jgi:potassium uptake TrkH family protein|uniref:TrkH family potassium uptake protein n=1 Tax=Eisenibacter elegans TaxID=997 RepID=UPI000409CBF4|nr:potassium transporter TrkG [Eisenibacter elegans]
MKKRNAWLNRLWQSTKDQLKKWFQVPQLQEGNELLLRIDESLQTFLFKTRDKAFVAKRVINVINTIITLSLLVYTFGFELPKVQITRIFNVLEVCIGIFAAGFFLQLIYEPRRSFFSWQEGVVPTWLFLKKNALESTLIALFLIEAGTSFIGIELVHTVFVWLGQKDYRAFYEGLVSAYLLATIIIQLGKVSVVLSASNIKPAATFIFSFILLILLGTGALLMPAMTTVPGSMRFIDALFTSTSASCVTGLVVQDTATFFTFKGQLTILILIQLGGIGIVSFASFFATFLSQGVGIKQQAMIQDMLSSESLSSAKGMLRRIVGITFLIEALGAILIFMTWSPEVKFDSLGQKIYFSIFHSISGFCNAGFSLFSNGLYEEGVRSSYVMHVVMIGIIFFGSLGFAAIEDIFSLRKMHERLLKPWKQWSLGTRIAVNLSFLFTGLGAIVFYFLERNNDLGGIKNTNLLEGVILAAFQSITTRTAGFNTVDMETLAFPTMLLMMFLMFVGASPGSTGGGIKTTTFYLLAISSIASIRGKRNVEIGKRNVAQEVVSRAASIFTFAVAYNAVCLFLLSIVQPDMLIHYLLFEQVSAFATAGLSIGMTSQLNDYGKAIIILSMYLGRVGTLTLALALSKQVISTSYQYPTEHLMVG